MQNIILKVWNEADKETRVDFVIEMIKRYHVLTCAALQDMNYCSKAKSKPKENK